MDRINLSLLFSALSSGYASTDNRLPSPEVIEPTNANEALFKITSADAEMDAKYQAWISTLPPEQQAWERTLQENLMPYYRPLRKQAKVNGTPDAWDFVQDDPTLPHVLLIGDSISRGYTLPVRQALAGKANVHRAPANCGPTELGVEKIDLWIGNGKWDVIHFNFGCHDRETPITDYISRLEQIIERMRKTGARLVWAHSTPIPNVPSKKYVPASIIELNAAAAEVMKRNGIPVDDLFSAITPMLSEMQNRDDVHFNDKGYEFLGLRVAASIETVLKRDTRESLQGEIGQDKGAGNHE